MNDNPTKDRHDSSAHEREAAIIEQIKQLPDVDVPQGMADQIMTAIRSRKQPWWRTFFFRLSRTWTFTFTPIKWVPAGTALLLGLVIGYGLNPMSGDPGSASYPELTLSIESAETHHKLGRHLLAIDRAEEALVHLKRAAQIQPGSAPYHFWVGVNFWTLKDADQELAQYQEALRIDPDFLPAHVYIGHNYLDRDNWQMALSHYDRVLQDLPDHPEALFNKAIALRHQDTPARENKAWRAYLDVYNRGQDASRAVSHLNANGDFSFRRIQLGPLEIVKRSIVFPHENASLDVVAQDTLDDIGRVMAGNGKLTLHIVAYVNNDADLAKSRARAVKQYLTKRYHQIAPYNIKLSWFGVPETVHTQTGAFHLDDSLRLFATQFDKS